MIKRILLLTPLLIFPLPSFSHDLDVTVMGGPSWSRLTNNTTAQVNQFQVNNYFTQTKTNVSPMLGVGLSHTFMFAQPFSISAGLSGYYNNFNVVQGIEYPFANDGIYDTLSYKFKAQSYSVLAESRFTYTAYDWQPFILAGVGAGWNRLYGYNEVPTTNPFTAASAQDVFSGNTQAEFAYEVGIGVQRQIYREAKSDVEYFASLDYRYMNFGKAQLATATSETTNHSLGVSHLDAQAVVFSLKATI